MSTRSCSLCRMLQFSKEILCFSVSLPIYLPLSVCLSRLSVCLSICLSVYLSVCLFVSSVYLSVCLVLWVDLPLASFAVSGALALLPASFQGFHNCTQRAVGAFRRTRCVCILPCIYPTTVSLSCRTPTLPPQSFALCLSRSVCLTYSV